LRRQPRQRLPGQPLPPVSNAWLHWHCPEVGAVHSPLPSQRRSLAVVAELLLVVVVVVVVELVELVVGHMMAQPHQHLTSPPSPCPFYPIL